MIDLGEIGRLERHAHPEFRQRVMQIVMFGIKRMHAIGSLRLQPPLHLVQIGEGAQFRFVTCVQRRHVTQYQHRQLLAMRTFADGQFDLRQRIHRIHGADQFAQGHQQRGYVFGQDAAGFHVRDKRGTALVETDKHAALFRHVTH